MSTDEIFEIPESNLDLLQLKIGQLARKAAKLGLPEPTLEIVGERMVPIKKHVPTGPSYEFTGLESGHKRKVIQVIVTGEAPQVEGWAVIAQIEHLDKANIIKVLPGHRDQPIPTRYRTAEPICEHCKLVRSRKITYLILSEDDEILMVGSDCIKDFTGHINPETLARIFSHLHEIVQSAQEDDWSGDLMPNYVELEDYLEVIAAIIRQYGWVPRTNGHGLPTADQALDHEVARDVERSPEDLETAKATIDWVRHELGSQDNLSDYEWNLVTIFGDDDNEWIKIKHAGYVASAVKAYKRHLGDDARKVKEEESKNISQYQGEIKERIERTLTLVKSLEFESDFGYNRIYNIEILEDPESNIYIWKTSASRMREGETYLVKATVKAHEDYHGVNQTILTRCQVLCPECGGKLGWHYKERTGGEVFCCSECYDKEFENEDL